MSNDAIAHSYNCNCKDCKIYYGEFSDELTSHSKLWIKAHDHAIKVALRNKIDISDLKGQPTPIGISQILDRLEQKLINQGAKQ